jgi:hypothetical protein
MKTPLKELEAQITELRGRITELEKVNDASAIIKRLDRIEKALLAKKLIRLPGVDVTDATWMQSPLQNKHWQVHFEYLCQSCDETHAASLDIPAHSKDGAEYDVIGPCGKSSRMRVWKKGATVFFPEAGPNGSPLVFGGL